MGLTRLFLKLVNKPNERLMAYLSLKEAKSGTDITLTECAVFKSEYLHVRDKLLINISTFFF